MSESRTSALATLALLAMAATWGSTFYLIHDLVDRVPPVDFLALRFLIAAIALFAVAPRTVLRLSPQMRRRGLALGAVYGSAQILQTIGLAHTPASVSGFVTGMYVVLTPIFAALILRHRLTWLTWAAVLLAITGIGVLTLDGFSIGYGEAITLVSAGLYALHIVGLGAWSRPSDALGMSILQMLVIAVICTVGAAPGGIVLPSSAGDWWAIVYMALIPGAAAILAQTWAQGHLPATRSAIIMSSEPVFAASFAVWLGGESVGWRLLVGGSSVLLAMLIVELLPRRKIEAEVTHLTV